MFKVKSRTMLVDAIMSVTKQCCFQKLFSWTHLLNESLEKCSCSLVVHMDCFLNFKLKLALKLNHSNIFVIKQEVHIYAVRWLL